MSFFSAVAENPNVKLFGVENAKGEPRWGRAGRGAADSTRSKKKICLILHHVDSGHYFGR